MKGIITAAGKGTRLYPATLPVCKPLLPVYDKPLIYYPLAVLMKAGIKDILVIVPPGEKKPFEELLSDGSQLGINIFYEEHRLCNNARGIADAFMIGKEFIGDDDVCLALGDNVFYCDDMDVILEKAMSNLDGAVIFGYRSEEVEEFGVVEFDKTGKVVSIEEKPSLPRSKYIVPGLYFYNNDVIEIAENLKPSARGELEITDVNLEYMRRGKLDAIPIEEGFTWIDAGNADSLFKASYIIRMLQGRDRYIGCVEKIAYEQDWIGKDQLLEMAEKMESTRYGKFLINLAKQE